MKSLHWLVLGLALLLSTGLVAPVSARSAPTSCAGQLSDRTIRGDVIVAEGEQCALINVTVRGDVRVQQRSTVEIIDSRIEGTLRGARFELVETTNARVGEGIQLTGGVSTWLELTTVRGDVRLIGNFDMRVLQSRVTGDLIVRGAREVALFCGSTVEGNARFADNGGGVLVGGDLANCRANTIGKNLRVHHNRADLTVANNTVGRNLVCVANEPAPTVFANQVTGATRGQCGAGEPVDNAELGNDA